MKQDITQTERFLSMLDLNAEKFTFQTFDDSPQKCSSLCRTLHGSFAQHVEELCRLNDKGACICVMVNQGDGIIHPPAKTCRTARNVQEIRTVFVDLDGAPLEPLLNCEIPPHIIVESSPERYHGYWIVENCSLGEFSAIQKALAQMFDGDPSVSDLPRIMRLPGFFHHKSGQPFLSKIIRSGEQE